MDHELVQLIRDSHLCGAAHLRRVAQTLRAGNVLWERSHRFAGPLDIDQDGPVRSIRDRADYAVALRGPGNAGAIAHPLNAPACRATPVDDRLQRRSAAIPRRSGIERAGAGRGPEADPGLPFHTQSGSGHVARPMVSARSRPRWRVLDPPATPAEKRRARRVASATALSFVTKGASAVVLAGSWARGDAHRESDIDLWVFGLRSGTDVLWRDPFMVTVKRTTEGAERTKLRTPPYVGGSVPAWKVAKPLHDPEGIARRLRSEAARFRWALVSTKCDRWVAEQTVGWAEEAVKLVRALATGNDATAAVQRDLLADHLGFVLAIHRRLFWDSENEFWERIGRRVGGKWGRALRASLGVPGGRLEASCRAALSLYALTAREVKGLLGPEQLRIVSNTCRVAGLALG